MLVGRTSPFYVGLCQATQAAVFWRANPWRFVLNHSLEALVFIRRVQEPKDDENTIQ